MKRTTVWLAVGALALALLLPGVATAQDSKLKIGGTTYTKWLWGNQRFDGSLYNFTSVPGEGWGDNGQGSEVELLLSARLSKEVAVSARLHSRFSQNQWTNFGGFGGNFDPDGDGNPGPCVGGDCGEFDSRSNQYVKLRGGRHADAGLRLDRLGDDRCQRLGHVRPVRHRPHPLHRP